MSDDQYLPALRAINITPFRHLDGRLFFELRDMLQVAPQPLAVSGAGYLVLAHLDGTHTIEDIQEAFRQQSGQELPAEEIEQLVAVLDHYTMLDTPRFAEAFHSQTEAYRSATTRDNRDRWPPADELRSQIEQILSGVAVEPVDELHGIIAPHLDYQRGAPCYAAAYSMLTRSTFADRYVILGTNHFGRSTTAVATKHDFQTPLGLAHTDREFIERIEDRLGTDFCHNELDHRSEHSVELQVHIMQLCQPERAFEIVPILCPDICGTPGTAPGDKSASDLGILADTLTQIIMEDDKRTVLIAGADLSHVGVSFADESPTTPEFLAEIERQDRRLLELIVTNKFEEFITSIRITQNPTRICSTGCLYVLRRALRERPCRLLHYHQAVDPATDTNVTCAAAVVL